MALHALTKINGKLKCLYWKQSFLSTYLRKLLCNAKIQPHFDFACLAWYPCLNNKFKKKIQVAQNKCIRFCLNSGNRFHIETKQFEAINWLRYQPRKGLNKVQVLPFLTSLLELLLYTYLKCSSPYNGVILHADHKINCGYQTKKLIEV